MDQVQSLFSSFSLLLLHSHLFPSSLSFSSLKAFHCKKMSGNQPTKVEMEKGLSSSLRWRRDLLLMPLLTIAFGLQFYDKAILGSALLFGIATDLNLSQKNGTDLSRYSTATACFYYGYLVGSLPASYLSQRLHLSRYLGSAVILWGIIVILTPVISDYRGLYAQR